MPAPKFRMRGTTTASEREATQKKTSTAPKFRMRGAGGVTSPSLPTVSGTKGTQTDESRADAIREALVRLDAIEQTRAAAPRLTAEGLEREALEEIGREFGLDAQQTRTAYTARKALEEDLDRITNPRRKAGRAENGGKIEGAYSFGKSVEGAVVKGLGQVAQFGGDTFALAEDIALAPFELLSGNDLGTFSDKGLFNWWAADIRKEQEAVKKHYAPNAARGGKAAQVFEELGSGVVAAVPQAVLALLTGGGSAAAQTTAGLTSTAAQAVSPGVAATVQGAVRSMAKNPQYWTSFAQVVGSSYEDALDDMMELEAQKEMTAALIGETYEPPENQNAMRAKAALYAIGNGLMNAAVEIGGGIQTLPDQLRRGQGAWKSWVEAMVDEGKEEVVQGVIERALQNPMYGAGNPLFSTTDERAIFNPATAAQEFAGGAVVGGVLGGGQIAAARGINAAARRAAEEQARRQAENTPAPPSGSGQEAETAAGATDTTTAQAAPAGTQNAAPEGAAQEGPVQVGRVTTIQRPYQGTVPVQAQGSTAALTVSGESIHAAADRIQQAQNRKNNGQGFKSALKNIYKSVFQPARGVPVTGMTYEGQPYTVDINSNVPGKVISDPNLTAEKLALLDMLPEVVRNGTYVGSGEYVQHGRKQGAAIRYDYFETPVTINGQNFIAKFDVEVLPMANNYRTHQIIKIDLTPDGAKHPGPAPGLSRTASSPVEGTRPLNSDSTIAPGAEIVNTQGRTRLRPAPINYDMAEEGARIVRALKERYEANPTLENIREYDWSNGSEAYPKVAEAIRAGFVKAGKRKGGLYVVRETRPQTETAENTDQQPVTAERTEQNGQQGDRVSDGDLGRLSGTGTGEQAGGMGEGAERGRGPADTYRAARERQNSVHDLRGEPVSSRDLGLPRGTDAKTLQVIPESAWDDGLRATADRVREETGLDTVFVTGGIQIGTPDGARLVRGVFTGDRIIVQADNIRVTPDQIADHEIFHDRAAQTPGLILELETRIREQYGAEELNRVVDRYIQKLRGVIDVTENTGEDGTQAEAWAILEEIFADAYAGINAFSVHAERFNETVEQTMTERGVGRGSQNAAATDRTTGPPAEGRYSFGGENAQRADLEALDRAQDMERRGVAMENIFRETGWYTGADGKWRFEIDDSGMEYSRWGDMNRSDRAEYARFRELEGKFIDGTITQEEQTELRQLLDQGHGPGRAEEQQTLRLSDFVRHDELYQNYPQLRQAALRFADLPEGTHGSYNTGTNTITLNNSLRDAPEDTLVHEIQHAIQSAEGFSGGSSPEYWARREYETGDLVSNRLQQEYDQILNGLGREDRNRYTRYTELGRELESLSAADPDTEAGRRYDRLEAEQDAIYEELYPNAWFRQLLDLSRRMEDTAGEYRRMYENTAGEIEARDVTARRQLTPEQRRQTMPNTGDENTVFSDSDAFFSAETDTDALKERQMQIIQETNPADDDYHTWIRSAEEIKTFREAIEDPEWAEYDEYNPDFTRAMAEEALESGEIEVFSSYPIEAGGFVSPSRMEAESYSGNGRVYSKTVPLTDVAWIDPTQGQYAPVDRTMYSMSEPTDAQQHPQGARRIRKTAEPSTAAQDEAERLLFQGVDADTIREMTGLERTEDHGWRFTVDTTPEAAYDGGRTTDQQGGLDDGQNEYDLRGVHGENVRRREAGETIPGRPRSAQRRNAAGSQTDEGGRRAAPASWARGRVIDRPSRAAGIAAENAGRYGTDLSVDEEGALLSYKSGDSYKLNAALRDGDVLDQEQYRTVEALDSALEKLPVYPGRVYRRLSFDLEGQEARDAFLKAHRAGADIWYPAYTSTSKAADGYPVEGDLTVTQIIEGANGRDLDGIGNNFESEVVFPRGSTFSIERTETDAQGNPVIYMREVTEDGAGQLYPEKRNGRVQQVPEVPQGEIQLREVPGVDSSAEASGRLPGLRGEGAGVNSDTRYSVDEDTAAEPSDNPLPSPDQSGRSDLHRPRGMSDEQYNRLNERWKNRPVDRRETLAPEGFDSIDDYTAALEAAAEERMRNRSREEFEGSDALKDLGIRIANSVGLYGNTQQLIENDRAAKSIRKEIKRAERRLQATDAEKNFASGVAAGIYGEADIPPSMDADTVMELADYYWAEKAVQNDLIREQRTKINRNLDERVRRLMDGVDDTKTKVPAAVIMRNRTPERNMRRIFGNAKGDEINDYLFRPVQDNEAERIRFVNRMHNEVRTFKDRNGKDRKLDRDERALVQLVIEGRAAEDAVNAMERSRDIQNAAENIKNARKLAGKDDLAKRRQAEIDASVDEAREFNLGTDERRLAIQYSRWLETQERLQGADTTIIGNAVEKYRELFNQLYDAANDFLVAHGYEPIGFIRGYAPHLQSQETQERFNSALERMGINREIGKLPTSIAGRTKNFKPNMPWNGFFKNRNSQGEFLDPDIAEGFEKYVDSMSDVLYHTDDIMRTRAFVRYFRRTYAPEEIRNQLEQADALRYAQADQQASFLRDKGKLSYTSAPTYEDVHQAMEQYVEDQYQAIENLTLYGDLAVFLDDYANNLANKQLFEDRAMEKSFGRTSLNAISKAHRAFARAQVSANLSSALNQGGQLPIILAENGARNVAQALIELRSKDLKSWAAGSDFLTEKKGINYIVTSWKDRAITGAFKPLEIVDGIVSTLAVRSRYLKEVRAGKSAAEAMRLADRFGREVMASRAKGSVPLAFRSKDFLNQMVHMFQLEALNNWEHVIQDLGNRDFREMARAKGKRAAAGSLAAVLVKIILGAFLLNRIDEELYGGTPAPFDVLGLAGNLFAGGLGLTQMDLLGTLVDNGWERLTGERLFGTDAEMNEFDAAAAFDDFVWNGLNEIPFASNVAALAGMGDRTLPMPDLSNLADLPGTIAEDGLFSWEVARQLAGLAGDVLPGGRQIEKSIQGGEALLRGGYYRGSGENRRLQFPVEQDFWSIVRGTLFGRSALDESRDFYASGQTGLSANQTKAYEQIVDMGADPETVYQAIQRWRTAENDEDLNSYGRGVAKRDAITEADLTDEQKLALYRGLSDADSSTPDHFRAMMDTGLSWEEVMEAYDQYQFLNSDEDVPEADRLSASEKATEFASWVDWQNYTEDQTETVKEALRYWQMIPAEASEKILLAQEYGVSDSSRRAAADEIDRLKGDGTSVTQDLAEEAIRNVPGLDNQERAILWQLQNKSWKWNKNPFDKRVGREVYDRMHEEDEA